MPTPAALQAFITKWQASGAAERANSQLFLAELCDVLEVPRPQPKTPVEADNEYCFEKSVPSAAGTTNFIDLYKRGCFVLESKQGVAADASQPLSQQGQDEKKGAKTGHGKHGTKGWDTAMMRAHAQAQRYARALPKEEIPQGRPPFVVVVDVGHSIALYTDWTRMGGEYLPFPDPASYRIALKDLLRTEVRERLHAVWTDPLSLDPGRRSAKVTRDIADRLARLARSLEGQHSPEAVSGFLMRCLFTMFSEDVDLLPHGSFTKLLGELKSEPGNFKEMLEHLWGTMNTGGLSPILRKKVPKFNGGLFAHADAIALNADQIQLLIEASTANWKDVEPAIFGTLLERALDPRERHKLGAHYTPRAYVERLVNPTVIEPLRAQWASVQVAALQLAEGGEEKKAIKQVEAFLHQLATVRVLDPACGSGNFLYVTLELLKRLEGEVLNTLHDLGATSKLELEGVMVTPANFFGIELNPRAAAIAEQVLWIGFLQWHLRTHGNLQNLPEPIIKDLHNIECRDAVLEYDERIPMMDTSDVSLRAQSRSGTPIPLTRWDGHTTKPHPVTGEAVPDPDARVPVYTYTNPRPAKWPKADYIVGNPPFIGTSRMREALGDGYTEALRNVSANVPDSADFVMYWWDKAAEATRTGKVKRFGFITTNSLRQTFNRKVLQHHMDAKKPISLAFAIPDHPWVDSGDGAAVRVAMTVSVPGKQQGLLQMVVKEVEAASDNAAEVMLVSQTGKIYADLTTGADVASATQLEANRGISNRGVTFMGDGFIVEKEVAVRLGYGSIAGSEEYFRPILNGKDVSSTSRGVWALDFWNLQEAEVRKMFPAAYQWLTDTVKPEREAKRGRNKDADDYASRWWQFAKTRSSFRPALRNLSRFVVTSMTAKHRVFMFVDSATLPDQGLIAFGTDDAHLLGVLSSEIHVTWALAAGGNLGVGNDPRYNNSRCFETFPFPACTPAQQEKIRALGEQLDAHRKKQQALHPELTITGMYNVLEAVRAGTPLTAKEKKIHEQGLISILKQLHDELDAAVAEAYGWSDFPLPTGEGRGGVNTTDQILSRLVALNAERAAEEAKGLVRWLRPEYQRPSAGAGTGGKQTALEVAPAPAAAPALIPWPEELPAQAAALAELLATQSAPATVEDIAAHFEGKRTKKRLDEMERLLETLAAVGRARYVANKDGGGWASSG